MSVAAVIKKAWDEPQFKQHLLDDPVGALKQVGISLPSGVKLRVVEETASDYCLVIPRKPESALAVDGNVRKYVWN